MHFPAVLFALLPAVVSAHFELKYPEGRGDNDATQDRSPCGGLDTPSTTRTRWPITGGSQLSFEAGHAEANTAVYLGLGNKPQAKDFTIVLRDKFLQVGLGTFCWNDLTLPSDLSVKPGDNATIQVVQQGHTSGGLYNCADITFTDATVRTQPCANATGVSAEPATGDASSAAPSGSASPSSTSASSAGSGSGGSGSAAAPSGAGAPNAAADVGSALVAGVAALVAWLV